jgi:hypothetical protein
MEYISKILNKKHGFNNFKVCFIALDMHGHFEYNKMHSNPLWDLWTLSIHPYSFTGGLFRDVKSNENYINIIKSYDINETRITKEQIDNLI